MRDWYLTFRGGFVLPVLLFLILGIIKAYEIVQVWL